MAEAAPVPVPSKRPSRESGLADRDQFLASLDEAGRQIDRGEFFTQAEVEDWFEARRGRAALT
jgi:predicted transcriptional regulator